MNTTVRPLRATVVLVVALACLVACAVRSPAGISGRWQPVNRFAPTTQPIPLRSPYLFQVTPLDRTLKGVLERWARDRGMQLVYEHESDFTLHAPMADVRTSDLSAAAAQVAALYREHEVRVDVETDRIVVRRASGPLP